MRAKSIGLAWIVVKDFKKAIKFYTEVVGLKVIHASDEWGWAELEGQEGEGMRLGIAQYHSECQDDVKPGENAVVTFSVDNIEKTSKDMQKQGATLVGKIVVVPGHVKMQTMKDHDENYFQLVEELPQETYTTHEHQHGSSCCH